MGNVCCDSGQTFGVDDMRLRLEGQRKRAKTESGEPDMYVSLVQVRWASSRRFSPLKFALREVLFLTEVEIHGSAEEGADEMSKSPSLLRSMRTKVGRVSDKLAPAANVLKQTLRIPGQSRSIHVATVQLLVDLVKDFDQEEVEVKVREVHCDCPEHLVSQEALERNVAQAICTKVSEMASRMAEERAKNATRPRVAQGRDEKQKSFISWTPRGARGHH